MHQWSCRRCWDRAELVVLDAGSGCGRFGYDQRWNCAAIFKKKTWNRCIKNRLQFVNTGLINSASTGRTSSLSSLSNMTSMSSEEERSWVALRVREATGNSCRCWLATPRLGILRRTGRGGGWRKILKITNGHKNMRMKLLANEAVAPTDCSASCPHHQTADRNFREPNVASHHQQQQPVSDCQWNRHREVDVVDDDCDGPRRDCRKFPAIDAPWPRHSPADWYWRVWCHRPSWRLTRAQHRNLEKYSIYLLDCWAVII